MRFLIGATIACLAAAALYYSILAALAAYTPNIVVVPVIKLLSATAATASAVTAASAGAALLLIVGALFLLAYLAAQGISRLFNPRHLSSSPAVELSRPWYSPLESSLAWLWTPSPNRYFNHMTRNANGSNHYNPGYTYHRESLQSRDNLGRTHSNIAEPIQHHTSTRNASGVSSSWVNERPDIIPTRNSNGRSSFFTHDRGSVSRAPVDNHSRSIPMHLVGTDHMPTRNHGGF